MITLSTLNELPHIRHGFFTREGGVSQPPYDSLNCGLGSQDHPHAVAENRRHAMHMMNYPASALLTLHQAHTADVVLVDQPWAADQRPIADAMVTYRPDIVLGILTADCAPVLFADSKASIIGAAHAGWKGAIGGVLENTIRAMQTAGAKVNRIVAAIGPCIGQRSYEVSADFLNPFLAQDSENSMFFAASNRADHFLFDLPGYIGRRLAAMGLEQVTRIPADTHRDASRFFSYRRTTLQGGGDYGRQLSAIVLER